MSRTAFGLNELANSVLRHTELPKIADKHHYKLFYKRKKQKTMVPTNSGHPHAGKLVGTPCPRSTSREADMDERCSIRA